MKTIFMVMAIILVIFIAGCSQKNNQVYIDQQEYSNATIQTFQETGDALCTDEQGKPIIRFFATSWCPHCKWIKETYMGVMKKYIDEGKVTAYLWEVDAMTIFFEKEINHSIFRRTDFQEI